MTKPGRRRRTPSGEITHFTDREDQQELFRRNLFSALEPPLLVFFGVGGSGKTWLLKKLLGQIPTDTPRAFLDFDRTAGGRRFVFDPPAALYEIRQQFGKPTPRFDLAFGILRFKQGASEETSVLTDLAAELAGAVVPGAGTVLKWLSGPLLARLKGTPLEEFLAKTAGQELALELRSKTTQEIGAELMDYLAEDLRKSLTSHLNRAVSAVLFFDTFEAVSSEAQNEEHKRQYEQWIRDIASNFEFALTVIAGQNHLTWEEIDPEWKDCLDQHLVGGLSEADARRFMADCEIDDQRLQAAILATAKEEDESYHCFSLGLCADVVALEGGRGKQTSPESLRFAPQDWENLVRRFLKSLASDAEGRWIERLALTPRFDEGAARKAFSNEHSAAQDVAWEMLPDYSFVERLPGSDVWLSVRTQMRWALENQPSARERVSQDHAWWQRYWTHRAESQVDRAESLAWYHQYCVTPETALDVWNQLAGASRNSVPPRMSEHFGLLQWWEPVDLLDSPDGSLVTTRALVSLAFELQKAPLGSRSLNLHRAIAYYETALHVYTELNFPKEWAMTQNNMGLAWSELPTGDRGENLGRAIECYEAALRVRTEQDFAQEWGTTQNNLGAAWSEVPTGDRRDNLGRAIAYYEAALRVRTEQDFPQEWATTQNNLGAAWWGLPTGDRGRSLGRAIECYEAALRVYTEKEVPQNWATTQNNLGTAWSSVPTGDRGENLGRAIEYFGAALRVRTEKDFPQDWARTQNNLGEAWRNLPTGDRAENLVRAIAFYEAALRVYTEKDFPHDWARTQNNLGLAWNGVPTEDREENLRHTIAYYEAALRVYTEKDFPQDWATTQNNLGAAWWAAPAGDRGKNLVRAIAYYEAALRVRTEEDFPRDWATTQNNLGAAWRGLPIGDRRENLHRAITCYEDALRVYTEKDFPQEHGIVSGNKSAAREEFNSLGDSH
jgi:tetratricopeptide (TPR) repeat protein